MLDPVEKATKLQSEEAKLLEAVAETMQTSLSSVVYSKHFRRLRKL